MDSHNTDWIKRNSQFIIAVKPNENPGVVGQWGGGEGGGVSGVQMNIDEFVFNQRNITKTNISVGHGWATQVARQYVSDQGNQQQNSPP